MLVLADGAPPPHGHTPPWIKVYVVVAHFPDRGLAIEEFATRNEDFRFVCADLTGAEAEAARWEHSSLPASKARFSEYRELRATSWPNSKQRRITIFRR